MLVTIAFGSRVGQVLDLPPLEARALVADGRATWPEGSPFAVVSPGIAAPAEDRGMHRSKPRARR